jgi:hypothetical protein
MHGQQQSGRAETALQAMFLPERLLDRMQSSVLGQPLDSGDFSSVRLNGHHQA